MTARRLTRADGVALMAAAVTVAVTAALGFWQLDRGAQKMALAQTMRERAAMPALTVPPRVGEIAASSQWHRPITVQGRWLPQHTVFLDNRQMTDRGRARVGFDVVTPLQLPDGTAVLVQRGWMARNFAERSRIGDVPTPDGTVTVQGRYAPSPPRLYEFKTDAQALGRVRQNLDVDAFAAEIGVAFRPGSVVQLGDDGASSVLKRAWSLPDAGVARHHGYAFQWFALSVLAAGMTLWFQVLKPRWRSRRR